MLLLAALVAVIVIRQMGGFSFSKLFDSVAPPSASTPTQERPFQRLEVKR